VYLHSENTINSSNTLKNKSNYINQQDGSMQVAVIEEDLQFIAQILQEQLRAEIPSGEFFQVKCAVKNDQLMILTQHPQGVAADTENIFTLLEDALQSLLNHHGQRVEIFLRIAGVKLPYAKHSLILKGSEVGEEEKTEENPSPFTTSYSYTDEQPFAPTDSPEQTEEEPFDPMADAPDLSFYTTSKSRRSVKGIVLGIALVTIAILSGGAYFLTRPCVMFECKEIQTAEELQKSFRQLINSAKSETNLTNVQQQLSQAVAALQTIPNWSPRYQEAEKLTKNLSERSETIDKVVKAFSVASLAAQKSKTSANSLEELKARQNLWRQAIAPLETIGAKNELYGLVQPQLATYRARLHSVNQQLLVEDKWLKKLTAAKDVANAATKRENTAKTLPELQKVQSTWQVAVNALISIPKNSPAYPEAQTLLADYKPKLAIARDRATKQVLAAQTYKQAVNVAEQAKRYEKQNQWQAAVTYWNQALSAAKQVSTDSFYYTQAQTLIEPYSTSLKQAEEKLQAANFLQQTRTDLEKTCSGAIRVCNFTLTAREIMVRITPEYEEALNTSLNQGKQNAVADVTNHLQSLQQALEVISDNANLAVIVFDAQGNQIHGHVPGG
jgi:bisphosphoglycerate-dependent phosphoglycerate mutase